MKLGRFDDSYLKSRRVFLWGPVTDESAKHVIDRLLYLETTAPGEEIRFYINSPGGMVTAGNAIMDVMNLISSPVATICMGLAASMGSLLLSAGAKGRRFVFPNGRVMIHQPSIGGMQGTAADIEITTEQILKTREIIAQILADNCGQPKEKVLKDLNRDYWMDAQESLDYGIVDGVSSGLI
ncbi:MAG: ATP-dependent Clp protease proteolytic subunit [Bacteroidetes bacterium]|nr:MAG: ATP-dependent Clp protease proteolytic subunit [Bacteroidota bacterium]